MNDPMHHQLLGHLLGALDDEEQSRIEARLERDAECCQELLQWRRRLAPLEALRPDFEPPPGLAERTCRYVAACMPVPGYSQQWRRRRKMGSQPTPPSHVSSLAWLDVAVVALVLLTTGAMILPAIDSSRFHARLASCQDDLRQFGLALSEYGRQQGNPLGHLAGSGRLTPAGVFAANSLRDEYRIDNRRTLCPDAWLAAQGAPRESTRNLLRTAVLPNLGTPLPVTIATPLSESPLPVAKNWPGAWRNGTTNGWRTPPLPDDLPLLADAPSADLPGQTTSSHGGLGRNVLFADGRVDFLPTSMPLNSSEPMLTQGDDFSPRRITAPIIFVSGR